MNISDAIADREILDAGLLNEKNSISRQMNS